MRQFGEVPPWLAANNTPVIATTSGFGTGGGAGVQTPDSSGFGDIYVNVGRDYSANWTLTLQFPSTPPTLFIAADEAFGTITQSTTGNNVQLVGTGAKYASPGNGKTYKIHYEWSVSK